MPQKGVSVETSSNIMPHRHCRKNLSGGWDSNGEIIVIVKLLKNYQNKLFFSILTLNFKLSLTIELLIASNVYVYEPNKLFLF